jgi:hypothetical protein
MPVQYPQPPQAQFSQLSVNSGPGNAPRYQQQQQQPRTSSYGVSSPPQPPGGFRAANLGVPSGPRRSSAAGSSQASSAASSVSIQHDGSKLCITLPTMSDLAIMHDSAAASGQC